MADEQAAKAEKEREGPSLLEWIAAAVGGVIALAMIGLIGFEALRSNGAEPPLLQVRPLSVTRSSGLHVMEVAVRNRGDQTAGAVSVEGELKQGDTSVETSSATLTYVPGRSERRGGLIFTRDPRRYRLELRATGYEEP